MNFVPHAYQQYAIERILEQPKTALYLDMGLGKTVQIIALILANREAGRTSLVVAPTSLTYNWLSEIRRFAPDLSAVVLNGNGVIHPTVINGASV